MKQPIVLIVLALAAYSAVAQPVESNTPEATPFFKSKTGQFPSEGANMHRARKRRYGAWPIPVFRSTVVNGIAVGICAAPYYDRDSLAINGISIDPDPLPLLATTYCAFMVPLVCLSKAISPERDSAPDSMRKLQHARDSAYKAGAEARWREVRVRTTIRGMSVNDGVISRKVKVNGVAVNATFAAEKEMNGAEFSGVFNKHYRFNGLLMSVYNFSWIGHGMQIGLVNNCKEGKLLQIGLINKIGKRTVPLINFSLKRKKSS